MKKYKIIIYSKKKIFIQLLYTYIREWIERKNKEEYILSIMIEGRSSMETIDAESRLENCILLFDCSDNVEIDNLKKILSKRIESCEGIVSNKQSVYIILFDNIYCRMEETLFFQEKDNLYFIDDLQELTEIIEKITDTDDDSKKASDNLTRREREKIILQIYLKR